MCKQWFLARQLLYLCGSAVICFENKKVWPYLLWLETSTKSESW